MSTTEYKALFKKKAKQILQALDKLEEDLDAMSEKLMKVNIELANIKTDFDFIEKKPKEKTKFKKHK